MTFESNILPWERLGSLKNTLNKTGFIRAIEAHSGLSGLIVESSEFDAIWESSLTDSASKGLPDASIVGNEGRLHTINEILNVTTKPMIVDGDTGGDSDNFRFLVKRLERLGVSAVIIEDKVFPKRNSFGGTDASSMEDPDLFSEKILAGRNARATDDFLIIARLESLVAGIGMNDTVLRAEKYMRAGADGIMIHSKLKNPEEIITFSKKFKVLCEKLNKRPYLISVPTTYNSIKDSELKNLGFNIVIHANHLLRASYEAMSETASKIIDSDRSKEVDDKIVPVKKIFSIVGYDKIVEREKEKNDLDDLNVIIPSAGESKDFNNSSKSFLEINGFPLIQHQIESIHKAGLDKIVVITPQNNNDFNIFEKNGVNLCKTNSSKSDQLFKSLLSARESMENGFLIIFGDIIFNEQLLISLINSDKDIVLGIDNSYKFHKHNQDKKLDLIITEESSETKFRSLNTNSLEKITNIGKTISIKEADGEFIGMGYFSKSAAQKLLKIVDELNESSNKFHEAKSFETADLTDVIQELIDRGNEVFARRTYKGWIEIHSMDDVKQAQNELKI
ncbi:MAG: phosphoenolpyruvate mutase [Chloroflexi bacterium]|nr:phosphoenolpyruvate mutase [Chloroflexota bacterium]|tara:strand:- start:727 stop:2415 length:1689 start_codon:yes stop_codon:yes gene_type:complete